MATYDDVARLVAEFAETEESERYGNRAWSIRGKVFAWERPFSKADLKRFGDEVPPDGPILATRVEDLGEKDAVLAARPDVFFTIPHLDGYPAVLVQLSKVSELELRAALLDGWLVFAPPSLAREQLGGR